MRSEKITLILLVMLFLVFPIAYSLQGESDSYTTQTKIDTISSDNSTSTTLAQRFIGGFGVVGNYLSGLFTGRFGILEQEEMVLEEIDSCGVLSQTNTKYVLNQSVQSDGTCFTITAPNIILDCQSYDINYSLVSNGYGIYSINQPDLIIENCKIYQTEESRINSYGIYLRNGRTSIIRNNTIQTSGPQETNARNYGIYFRNFNSSIFYSNNLNSTGRQSYNLYFLDSYSSFIHSNQFSSSGISAHNLYYSRSSGNDVFNNNFNSYNNSAYSIFLLDSASTDFYNNNLSSQGNSSHLIVVRGLYSINNLIKNNLLSTYGQSSRAFYSLGASNNRFNENNFSGFGNANFGVDLRNLDYSGELIFSNNNSINSNNIFLEGNSSYGIYLRLNSTNNTISNNYVFSEALVSRGLYIHSSNANKIANNSFQTISDAMLLYYGENNTLYNNHFNSSINRIFLIRSEGEQYNFFNTSKQGQVNIIGGNFIGGNYYTNLAGTGFSQRCVDLNNDGICDSPFELTSSNIDYYPLTTADLIDPEVEIFSPEEGSFINGVVTLQARISDDRALSRIVFEFFNESSQEWETILGTNRTINTTLRYYNYLEKGWFYSSENICDFSFNHFDYRSLVRCRWDTFELEENLVEGKQVRVAVYDIAGNIGYGSTSFLLDKSAPIILDNDVVYPEGQSSVRNGQTIVLNARVTDSPDVGAGIDVAQAYLLRLNESGYVTMDFISGSKLAYQESFWQLEVELNSTFGPRNHLLRVYDSASPTRNLATANWFVQIDNSPPTYSGLTHSGDFYNNTLVSFNLIANDNYLLSHYIFSHNYSGEWVNESLINLEGQFENIIYSKRFQTGNFNYKFYIFDDAGNFVETEEKTLEILGNRPTPEIILFSPEDNSLLNFSEVIFEYQVINSLVDNCSIYINDLLEDSSSSIVLDTTLNFSATLEDGNHFWNVICYYEEAFDDEDPLLMHLESEVYYLSVDTTPPIVEIISPLNETYYENSVYFNVSINEPTKECSFTLNSDLPIQMTQLNETYFYYFKESLEEGNYLFNVSCIDLAGNSNNSEEYFMIEYYYSTINLTYPLNGSEVVRGKSSIFSVGEDDKNLIDEVIPITAKVYDINTSVPFNNVECYFYEDGDFIGASATNDSGDCSIGYDKSSREIGPKNIFVNYSHFLGEQRYKVNNESEINFSLVKYVLGLDMLDKMADGNYLDGDNATLRITINKINESGTFLYDPQNISANMTNQAEYTYPEGELYYPGEIIQISEGVYNASVKVNSSFGFFVRWDVALSDDNFNSYLGSAIHADVKVCVGDFGSWSSWSACIGGVQTRIGVDSTNCTKVETQSCSEGGGGGGGCVPRWGDWSNWGDCFLDNGGRLIKERFREDGCGNRETERELCICEPLWSCSAVGNCINNTQEIFCTDLNDCEEDYSYFVECISDLQISYNPKQLSLYLENGSSVDFDVTLDTGINEGNLKVVWKSNQNEIKSDSGIGNLNSRISLTFEENTDVYAEISLSHPNLTLNQKINWRIVISGMEDCLEDWYCRWKPCNEEGFRVPYDCVDKNNCGTNFFLPSREVCDCIPTWDCSDWSDCSADYGMGEILKGMVSKEAMQMRTCSDVSDCNEPNHIETKSCSIKIPIRATLTNWCFEEYLEIREIATNNLVSRIRDYTPQATNKQEVIEDNQTIIIDFGLNQRRVDINLVLDELSGYCPYCYDGVQNFDEEGIDCGGPNCPPCEYKEELGDYASYFNYINYSLWILFLVMLLLLMYFEKNDIKQAYFKTIKLERDYIAKPIEEVDKSFTKKLYSSIKLFSSDVKNKVVRKVREKQIKKQIKKVVKVSKKLSKGRKISQKTIFKISEIKKKVAEWKQQGYYSTLDLEKAIYELEKKLKKERYK